MTKVRTRREGPSLRDLLLVLPPVGSGPVLGPTLQHHRVPAGKAVCNDVLFCFQVSWGSVAMFTMGRTRRATGLSEMTSSEGKFCVS